MVVLFLVYYAKEKFRNLRDIEGYLINHVLLNNMGLNQQLILKLVIYVSFITGDKMLELTESGMSLNTLKEEKKLFFNEQLEADYEECF